MKSIQFLFFLFTFVTTNAFSTGKTSFVPAGLRDVNLSTTTAPPREKTRTGRKVGSDRPVRNRPPIERGGPLEYLQDDSSLMRRNEDPFHILLLGSTFNKPRITTGYVSSSLVYVLDMPEQEAKDHAKFAAEQGMSCLGTWTREECLALGKQLQYRDLECRVVPFCEGGSQPWQAKRADMSNNGDSSQFGGFQ